jgi:hypothetical protein
MKRILVLLITLAMSGFGAFAQMQPRIGYDYATPNIGPELNAMRPSGELKINTIPGRSGGTGTFDDPYIVASEEELAEIATRVNSGTEASGTIFPNGNQGYAGQYFLLTKDLDLINYTPWTPISIPGQKIFFGHFDGGDHTIKHLTTDLSTSNDNQGLFSVIGAEASIGNLSIRESHVTGEVYTGAIVGAAGENSQIYNCHNYSDVNTTFYYTGGIAGASWGVIESCTNSGNIYSEMDFVGGIVGDFYGVITGCVNTGNVSGTTSVGGIIGYSANAAIDHNVNAGNIFASSVYSGGVVGFVTNYDSENTTAYLLNVGGVYGASTRAVIGRLWTEEGMPSHANNCYYDCQMTDKKGMSPGNDVEGVVEPRFTHEMLGDGLSELISTGWTFTEGLYPIPVIEPFTTDYSYTAMIAAVPASLRYINENEFDRFDYVRDDFHIYYDIDDLTWESATGKVSFYEDLAELIEMGQDTLRVYYGDAKKEIYIEITDMLGFSDGNQNNIAVYPNPTENYIYITYDQPYQAMLYTADGRLVGTCRHELGNTHPIDFTAFTSGVYYLRLVNDDGIVATKKIVVTK